MRNGAYRAGADDQARVIFVLDRRTGQPLFLVEVRTVPASDAEGERLSPVQPRPRTSRYVGLYTPPFVQGRFLW